MNTSSFLIPRFLQENLKFHSRVVYKVRPCDPGLRTPRVWNAHVMFHSFDPRTMALGIEIAIELFLIHIFLPQRFFRCPRDTKCYPIRPRYNGYSGKLRKLVLRLDNYL